MATGLGIDVGSESIKVVQVRVSGNSVAVTGALKIPRAPETVLDAPETESGAVFVPENLGERLKRAHLNRSGTVGISGREINLRYLPLAPMPPDKLKMVLDMEITGKLTAKGPASADTPAVTYDYRILNTPSGLKGDVVVMAGLCKNEYLFGVNSALKKAGIDAKRVTPACFGLVNACLRTQQIPENETVVLLDIGHELLEIAILEGNNLYFARSAPGGGKKFTAGLDKILKAGMQKAGEFKQNRVKLYPEGAQIPGKQELAFQAALKEAADNIAGSIRSSMMFCRTQARLPKLEYQRIFLSGGGARLNGLREYLEKKTGHPVQIMDLSPGLDLRKLDAESARCFEGAVPDMTVALGLAIIDAAPKSFHFTLVPEAVVKKRVFWNRTVYGIAAGVILTGGLYWPIQNSRRSADEAAKLPETLKQERAKAKDLVRSFETLVRQNQTQAKKVEYYAQQTRLNRVYLDLFSKLRSEMPPDITLNYFGPASEGNIGLGGGQGANMQGFSGSVSPGMGTWTAGEEAVLNFTVHGTYDPMVYPGTKFDETWEALRMKLLAIPGVQDALREKMTEADAAAKQGTRFQLNIKLKSCKQPLAAQAAPAPAESKPKEK